MANRSRDPRRNLTLWPFCIIIGISANIAALAAAELLPTLAVVLRLGGGLLAVAGAITGVVLAVRGAALTSKSSEKPTA